MLFAAVVGGCAALPPGEDFPRSASAALPHPEETRLGAQLAQAARQHDGNSGFRIISVGVDGFLARAQMIDAAERTLDLQYYIFRGDDTGRLLTDALLRAADRGVRVRVLIDDGDTLAGDEQIIALNAHPAVEIRIFNPFAYRGHHRSLRDLEFMFNHSRLDYRMHNKLLVADNAVALVGGRNIDNQYFQMDPDPSSPTTMSSPSVPSRHNSLQRSMSSGSAGWPSAEALAHGKRLLTTDLAALVSENAGAPDRRCRR
jgi:putative cardiolipin synthase